MQPTLQEPVKFGIMVFPNKIASALPLVRTQVNAHITGVISTVNVTQSFINPYESPIELEYLFPLPENAALVDFTIQIGPRVIRADLRESQQAQEAFEQARQEGKQAAKLDQRRPNLFAIQFANVLPSRPILVIISYENRLSINADELEFIFPMGLTPKYHSHVQSDEAKGVDAPVSSPGEQIGDVEITVTALLGQKTGTPISPSHNIAVENIGDGQFSINLVGQYFPDHDFILRFPLINKTIEPVVWCTHDATSEIALVNCLPVLNDGVEAKITPREFIFVLDRSGSMSGEPIRQARNALRACLRILDPQDTFRILLFDDQLEWYKNTPERVEQAEIDHADQFLNSIEGRGGTEIVQALEAALSLPAENEWMRYILFLTDGAVSAEDRALQSIRKKLNRARIFTFGIGPSVNRALLSKMAQLGRGAAEFLQINEDIEGAIIRFQDKVAFPVLTDIQIEWTGCSVWDMIPSILPDLYAGQNLQMVTRLKRDKAGQSTILHFSGVRGAEKIVMDIPIPGSDSEFPEITRAWAKGRIDELLEKAASEGSLVHQVRQEVIALAIEHRLVTPYTSFVALDPEVVNPKGEILTVSVAQPLPQGLNFAGFFPPLPVRMAAASFTLPGMPKFAQTKRSSKDNSAREKAVDHELYQQDMPAAMNFSQGIGEINAAPPDIDRPVIISSTGIDSSDPSEILRWLARTQNLNGSWSEAVEFTAAALLAFIRQGHTIRRGYYRKQVNRAAEWLIHIECEGTQAFYRACALSELSSADLDPNITGRIGAILHRLPPPRTPVEQTILNRINQSQKPDPGPQSIFDLDSLRIACILNAILDVPANLIENDPQGLVRVWMACLIPTGK